jgi:hypothetical protein
MQRSAEFVIGGFQRGEVNSEFTRKTERSEAIQIRRERRLTVGTD